MKKRLKVFLFYPPGEQFQRGEDRCQISVKSSTSNAMRACNDLGYMASVLRTFGDDVFLRDYATEGAGYADYVGDVRYVRPDVVMLSTTNTTIVSDLRLIGDTIRDTGYQGKVALKGAVFFDMPDELLDVLDLRHVDFLIGGEADWVIGDLIHGTKPLDEIPGILYKKEGRWIKTDFNCWNENLDAIPFPARDLMKNELYVRPDTGEPMATIQTGRGCPSNCIYCLSPHISGKKIRLRSPQNVMAELEECYHKYQIRNFFFRADTFTYNEKWVLEFCDLIKESDLYGKIAYSANSRVKPLSMETLRAMKDTGCFMIAFGLETGSGETMERIRKGVTVEDNYRAVRMAKQAGLPVFGFFMMGFPWETMEHLQATRKMIFELDCDFMEIHLALPYNGTGLYELCEKEGLMTDRAIGGDIFHKSASGTKYLSAQEIMDFRGKTLLQFHLRPQYILKKVVACGGNPKVVANYAAYGLRMVKNLTFGKGKR